MIDHYQSEISLFLERYKKDHPDLEMRQREGRFRLWDRKVLDREDSESRECLSSENIPQKSYVYYD